MKQCLNYTLSQSVILSGYNVPCIALIYPDGKIEFGSPDFVKIMLRKDATCIPCPMIQQVVDWLRTEHGLVLDVFQEFDGTCYTGKWEVDISRLNKYEQPHVIVIKDTYEDYYTAWHRAITESVAFIDKQKNEQKP